MPCWLIDQWPWLQTQNDFWFFLEIARKRRKRKEIALFTLRESGVVSIQYTHKKKGYEFLKMVYENWNNSHKKKKKKKKKMKRYCIVSRSWNWIVIVWISQKNRFGFGVSICCDIRDITDPGTLRSEHLPAFRLWHSSVSTSKKTWQNCRPALYIYFIIKTHLIHRRGWVWYLWIVIMLSSFICLNKS